MNEYEKLLENIERLKAINVDYSDGDMMFMRHLNAELEKFITILKLKGNNDDKNSKIQRTSWRNRKTE